MNATAFLEHLQGDGFTLSVNQSRLRVAPVSSLTPELRAGIVAHKAALLRLLAAPKPAEPNAEQYAVWRKQIMDGLRQLRDHDQAEFYALCEEIEERSAIMEFDGGLDRAEAERRAEWETLWLRFCAPDAVLLEM